MWKEPRLVPGTGATGVYTFPDGASCTIVSDSISVLDESRYNRDTVTCSP